MIGERKVCEYSVYRLRCGFKEFKPGQYVFGPIDYRAMRRSHYFTKFPGEGGKSVADIKTVESTPDVFEYIGDLESFMAANTNNLRGYVTRLQ